MTLGYDLLEVSSHFHAYPSMHVAVLPHSLLAMRENYGNRLYRLAKRLISNIR